MRLVFKSNPKKEFMILSYFVRIVQGDPSNRY